MGLTTKSTGKGAADIELVVQREHENDKVIALAGNPNVGKSTVFNALTGMRQHTGNWPGKTVGLAQGEKNYEGRNYIFIDLPGTYSLMAHSTEEEVARDFLVSGTADAAVVVCDATCLERNLNLLLQTMEAAGKVLLCVNLMDEAEKKGIHINLAKLEKELGIPVVGTSARAGIGLDQLMEKVEVLCEADSPLPYPDILNQYEEKKDNREENDRTNQAKREDRKVAALVKEAERIYNSCVRLTAPEKLARDRKLDRILTSKKTGIPIMLLLLLGVFWLTITGSNYPSEILAKGLFWVQDQISAAFFWMGVPQIVHDILVLGVYRVLAWVVSVMLPPMAIFFPLFTLLEDFGYLPRIAFVLDHQFQKACACGKQALTMCMGFGCNAAGVVGCRIIDSRRERLIAILTNNFVPCNGRFPILISVISMFFVGSAAGFWSGALSALLLTGVILLGVFLTFGVSRLLSQTLLKGEPSSFTLELPPYRRPQFGKVLVRSLLDRTLFVLGRAIVVAAPAGLLIWIMANIYVNGITLLAHCAGFLDPFGKLLGMDGMIILAFILGFPANEIVIPILIMGYMATGTLIEFDTLAELKTLLLDNGWTWITALSTMLFCLIHWPCSTTCLTIKKEAGGWKWVALSIAIPTGIGITVCFLFANTVRLLCLVF